MGFAFERKPSGSLLASGGAKKSSPEANTPLPSLPYKLEFVYLTITSIAVHLPLLQELSETLQAAIPSVTSTNASSTILLPAFESGAHTSMLPSALIFVYIKRFIGRMIGCDVQSALLMLSRQLEWS